MNLIEAAHSPTSIERKFGFLDMMIVIVATATGLAALRAFLNDEEIAFYTSDRTLGPNYSCILNHIIPFPAALSAALLVMRLRRPRPAIRDLSSEPGAVAMAFVVGSMIVNGINIFVHTVRWKNFGIMSMFREMLGLSGTAGQLILMSWLLLAWSNR